VSVYVPPGWPADVRPPGTEDFPESATAWLLDLMPPEYRQHEVLRRHPAVLASMARYYSAACVEGARRAYRSARAELATTVPPHAVDEVLSVLRTEGFRLAAAARAVGLVEQALRGEVFTPRF
jgi:hypothetical protein